MSSARLRCVGAPQPLHSVVVDMFAGIGYFTLPLAKHGGVKQLYAIEKNSESFAYLQANVALNKLEGVVTPLLGDNRHTGDSVCGTADRVSMVRARTTPRTAALTRFALAGLPADAAQFYRARAGVFETARRHCARACWPANNTH